MSQVRLSFGRYVREARQRAGLSVYDLAERVGISASYVGDIERGRRIPSSGVLEGLAYVLRLNPENLLIRSGRLPQDVQDYLYQNPSVVRLIRRCAELKLDENTVAKLEQWLAKKARRKTFLYLR